MISQQKLKEILHYCPETGIFTWKVKTKNNIYTPGMTAGTARYSTGTKCYYIVIGYEKLEYKAHRLAFLYMTGVVPNIIDHIDGDGTNNKWTNLRAATKSTNAMNSKNRRPKQSGYIGVNKRKDRIKAYRGYVTKDGKQYSVGNYYTPEEAAYARDLKALELFHDYAITNYPKTCLALHYQRY